MRVVQNCPLIFRLELFNISNSWIPLSIFPSLVLRGSRDIVTRVSFPIAAPSTDRSIRDEPYCLAQVAFFANWREREDTYLLFARSRRVYARVSDRVADRWSNPIHRERSRASTSCTAASASRRCPKTGQLYLFSFPFSRDEKNKRCIDRR